MGFLIKNKSSKKNNYEDCKEILNQYNENHEILSEGFYEWKIKSWSGLQDIENSSSFTIGNYKWKLKLNKNNYGEDSDFISIYLNNMDIYNGNKFCHIYTKFIFYIRNYYNSSNIYYGDTLFNYYDKNNYSYGCKQFIEKSDLLSENQNLNNPFIENDKCVIGVYVRIYRCDEENIINELKKCIKDNDHEILDEGFYECELESIFMFSSLRYSPEFSISNEKWRFRLENISSNLHVYLENLNSKDNITANTKANAVVYIRNYNDYSCFYYNNKDVNDFNHYNNNKYSSLIEKFEISEINYKNGKKLNKCLIEDNKFVLGVYIRRYKFDQEFIVNNIINKINDKDCEILNEGFYEWEIDDWNSVLNQEINSPEFIISDYKWIMKLNNTDSSSKIYLENINFINDESTKICAKPIIYVKNFDDNGYYYINENENFIFYNKDKQSDFKVFEFDIFDNLLVKSNKIIIGVYIRTYKYGKEYFYDKIKDCIKDDGYKALSEGFYEWNIENFTSDDFKSSSIFTIDNYKWKLRLENRFSNPDVYLDNINTKYDISCHICAKAIIFIRNYYDSDYYYFNDNEVKNYYYYQNDRNSYYMNTFNKSVLYSKRGYSNELIKNNKTVIGVYIRIYEFNSIDYFLCEINKCIINDDREVITDEIYEWEIDDYDSVSSTGCSPEFTVGNYKWKLRLNNNNYYPDIYLDNMNALYDFSTNICIKPVIYVKNYYNNNYYYFDNEEVDDFYNYTTLNYSHRIKHFNLSVSEIFNESIVENNKTIIGIYMCIYRYENPLKSFTNTPKYKRKFEDKLCQLRKQENMKTHSGETTISLIRDDLFAGAYYNIANKSPEELKKRLKINYEGESGVDAGGLLRDFFYNLSKEIGNPNYSLFQYSHEDSYELEINPYSGIFEPDHLEYFKFVGRIMGLAVFHDKYLPLSFSIIFYKKFLNKPLEFADLELIDPEFYKNILWLKNNEGAENLNLTFEIEEVDCFNNRETIELKPNGANIDVDDFNKYEYISLLAKYKLNYTKDKEQFQAIRDGFYEIIPENIISSFDEFDLKFLISGINEIDIDDWENNTVYENYNKCDTTIINFWKCVREFSQENRTRLLLFTTGTTQVPVTGFKDLQGNGKTEQFKIKRIESNKNLPISHTCFNRIDLPPYTTYTQLKEKLLLAISDGIGSFEID